MMNRALTCPKDPLPNAMNARPEAGTMPKIRDDNQSFVAMAGFTVESPSFRPCPISGYRT
jgi:hypothetical protein